MSGESRLAGLRADLAAERVLGCSARSASRLLLGAATEASTVRRAGAGVRGSPMVRYILDSDAGGLMGADGKVIVVTDGASGLRPAAGTGETL